MKSIYEITDTFEDEAGNSCFEISLNPEHKIYEGHFPQNPVTPGVVMLQILKYLTEEKLHQKLMMVEASNVKFLSMVNPQYDSRLIYKIKVTEVENEFQIKNTTTFPAGRLVLKCNATFVIR
ncbi:3-hydroxyacyl-[acyl-carrier-protein] dehydratase [Flavobacteriaceae bacterium MAR_2010_188]|nr:3-hydroxyacyl-[acyl-carrier-protein] dehydratase [Flavobacteriaceae bacterium MAR_2010_188]